MTDTTSSPVVTLAEGVVRTDRDVRDIRKLLKRYRTILVLSIVGLIIDIVLTVGLVYVVNGQGNDVNVQKRQTTTQAYQAHALKVEVYQRCVTGNVFRQRDKRLWDYVLHLSEGGPQTGDARRVEAHFRNLLDKLDAPVVCKL